MRRSLESRREPALPRLVVSRWRFPAAHDSCLLGSLVGRTTQINPVRKFFVLILALLCLGFASYPGSSSPVIGLGTPSLARERPETKFVLPSQRNAVQALVTARDPVSPSAGGSIVAVLPIFPGLASRLPGGLSARALSDNASSAEPDQKRARSPPLS